MFPIPQLLDHKEEFSIFLIPLIGVAGEAAKHRHDHKHLRQQRYAQIGPAHRQEHGNQAQNQTRPQKNRIELVRAVAAGHKAHQSHFQFVAKLSKPTASSVHGNPSQVLRWYYYMIFPDFFNIFRKCLRIVFIFIFPARFFVRIYCFYGNTVLLFSVVNFRNSLRRSFYGISKQYS